MALTVSNPFNINVVASQPPAYMSGMSAFQQRALTGVYAPNTGTETMRQAITAMGSPWSAWVSAHPTAGSVSAVINHWNSGAEDRAAKKLYVHGGGHNDSSFNGLPVFDFNGGARPNGWVVEPGSLSDPGLLAALGSSVEYQTYGDGKPGSVHTYDGLAFDTVGGRFYRFGGSFYKRGFFVGWSFYWDVNSKQWVSIADWPDAAQAAMTAYDPPSRKILVFRRGSTSAYFYNTVTNTWSAPKSIVQMGTGYGTFAYDSTRRRVIASGVSPLTVITPDWSAETISTSTLTPSGTGSGAVAAGSMAVLYDPTRDSFWLWGGYSQTSDYYQRIVEMNASTFACTEHALTGDAVQFDQSQVNYNGSYKRAILLDEWRALGVVTSSSHSAYIIKLP